MHTPEIQFEIVNSQQLDEIIQEYKLLESITLGELDLIAYALDQNILDMSQDKAPLILRRFLQGLIGETNVPIAAAVTAYSRIIINEYKLLALKEGLDIYYSDTDSLVLNGSRLHPPNCVTQLS